MEKSKSLIVKSNDLINARYRLTVMEMRLFLRMLTMIDRNDDDFQTYRIYLQDFIDDAGHHEGIYQKAEAITERLMQRILRIETPTETIQVAFLSSAIYKKGEGYVDLNFDPVLKPYLLQLKGRFTQYDIRNILKLQSYYSIRIYELLKQYEKLRSRVISVEELKTILDVQEKYPLYANLKQKVILQAQKELSRYTDLGFEFEEIKTGRKVTHLKFKIFRHQKKEPLETTEDKVDETTQKFEALPPEEQAELRQKAIDALDNFMRIQYEKHGLDNLAVKAVVDEKIAMLLNEK